MLKLVRVVLKVEKACSQITDSPMAQEAMLVHRQIVTYIKSK